LALLRKGGWRRWMFRLLFVARARRLGETRPSRGDDGGSLGVFCFLSVIVVGFLDGSVLGRFLNSRERRISDLPLRSSVGSLEGFGEIVLVAAKCEGRVPGQISKAKRVASERR